MAANPGPTAINTFPPPPPGFNYIAAIQPSITFLMIGTVFSGILLPLLVALFFFSTKTTRRTPIFILNVISLVLGLTLGMYNAYIEITALLSPLAPFWRYHELVFSIMMTFIAWIVETILLVRLLAVYPYSSTPKRIWFSIFIPLILLKVGRVINTTIFNAFYGVELRVHPYDSPLASSETVWHGHPNTKIEWILQVIDNTATSMLFIARLWVGLGSTERVATFRSKGSYGSRLKGLFWIAVSNFVFPVILSIIQLILLFHDPSYLRGSYIFMANDYVEIIGVLLATVWTTSNHWTAASTISSGRSAETSMRFAGNNIQLGNRTFGGSGTLGSSIKVNKKVAKHVDSSFDLEDLESRPEFSIQEEKPGRLSS